MFTKSVKDYVCPRCWHQVEECCCKYAPMQLVQIDEPVQYAIRTLNEKGYKTRSCCGGHYGLGYIDIHVELWDDLHSAPACFKPCGIHAVKYSYVPKKEMSEETFNSLQKNAIESLNEWVDELPNHRRIMKYAE